MFASAVSRPPNLLDQRFAPHPGTRPATHCSDPFDLQCSLMLAGNDVYLSDLAPETLSHVCERLRARHRPQVPAL